MIYQKNIQFFAALFTLVVASSQNQTLDWVKTVGGSDDDKSYTIATDRQGNVLTAGTFYGVADFDPDPQKTFNLTSSGVEDLFISKLDAKGNFVWAKNIGGVGYDDNIQKVVTDAADNVYITGFFKGTADFNPNPDSVFNLSSAGNNMDAFVVKMDKDGNFKWAKKWGALNFDLGFSLAVDHSCNVYTTGYFAKTVDFDPDPNVSYNLTSIGFDDAYILKLDSLGKFVWARDIGGGSIDHGKDIKLDGLGNIYLLGAFQWTANFNSDMNVNPYNITSAGYRDVFLLKMNPEGELVWAKSFPGEDGELPDALALDKKANIYIAGTFGYTVDFDPDPEKSYELTPLGERDLFVSKYDNEGRLVWAKSMGGYESDYVIDLAVDNQNNVYTTGHYVGKADFDPDPQKIFNLGDGGSDLDIFISKLDSNGSFVYAKTFGSVNEDYAGSIAIDLMNNVYTTGYFVGTADLDPNPNLKTNIASKGLFDIYIIKLKPCLDASGDCLVTSSTDLEIGKSLLFYPNPASGILHINTNAQVVIRDMTGKVLLNHTTKDNLLDISHIESGIYLLESVLENEIRVEKLTIE